MRIKGKYRSLRKEEGKNRGEGRRTSRSSNKNSSSGGGGGGGGVNGPS